MIQIWIIGFSLFLLLLLLLYMIRTITRPHRKTKKNVVKQKTGL